MNENITLRKHISSNINQVPKTEKANSEAPSCLTSRRSSSSSSYIYSLQRTRSKFEQTGKKEGVESKLFDDANTPAVKYFTWCISISYSNKSGQILRERRDLRLDAYKKIPSSFFDEKRV